LLELVPEGGVRIETKDKFGKPNGWLLPIWHEEWGPKIGQVYLTVVGLGCTKGPHLHNRRAGLFCCVRGDIKVKLRLPNGDYVEQYSGEAHGFDRIPVPMGVPAEIINVGDCDAYVLNMPNPGWTSTDPDEQPVENWQ
jgi:dTDP-4-dehydrorhamnose 3,5-epimerase-like enzyme